MTNEEWIKVGIIASKELNTPPDAKVEIAPSCHHYAIRVRASDDYLFATYDTDIVSPMIWRDEQWIVGLGYSKKFNILVVWPSELWQEQYGMVVAKQGQ